jgi:Pro-kumamolisin, activation domain/Viral BACON domain
MLHKLHPAMRRLCLTLAVFSAACPVFGAGLKTLRGHVPDVVRNLTPNGVVTETNELRLAIGLPLRDADGLEKFLADVYNPKSPNYRQFLSPEEFTERFGPTTNYYAAVENFALTNGLQIVGEHDNRLVLDVTGAATDIERAFHLKLNTYRHPHEARSFFAPDAEPSVDGDLPVADIEGLSDFTKPHFKSHHNNSRHASPRGGSSPDGQGEYFGDDFRSIYAPVVTLTGAGQMVGLLQFDGFYTNDISSYAQAAGGGRANIPINKVLIDGYDGTPSDGNGEVSLDIEMAMSMAPGLAAIVVFEGGPNGLQNDILNTMVRSNMVKSLSCSWGWGGGPSTTTDNIFKQMAAQGQSFFNASGDTDAFVAGSNNDVDSVSQQNAPSSSPYITQVGGTTLSASGGNFVSESVWNDRYTNPSGGNWGSSGGVSTYYSIPTWQTNISMSSNGGSTTKRNIPDVALTGDNVYSTYDNGSSGYTSGTSCSAPLWAGFMALVNQQAAAAGGNPAGFINPQIYALASSGNYFNDVTSGDNSWSQSAGKFSAVTGYDLASGLGSPNGKNLINALAGAANAFQVSPQGGYAASGNFGGPFTPSSGVFQLTNSGATDFNWSLICTSSWAVRSITNGTLAAGAVTNVTVTLAANATNLASGNYSTMLAFSNRIAHVSQKIPFTLQVIEPLTVSNLDGGVIAGQRGGPFTPYPGFFEITNNGSVTISWSLSTTSSWFKATPTSGKLAPGIGTNVWFSLNSTSSNLPAGNYSSTITFKNSTSRGSLKVPLQLTVIQPMALTPTKGFTAVGPVGGPFTVNSQDFSLVNTGANDLAWSLVNTSKWLVATLTNGILPAGGQTNLTISLSPTSAVLKAAVYSGNVKLTNHSGVIAIVPFSLSVGQPVILNGGFELGNFTDWIESGNTASTSVTSGSSSYTHSGKYGARLGPPSSPGYLTQNMTTIPGQTYLVSLWLRNASGQTPNLFSVQWDGDTIFSQSDITWKSWTNLQFTVTAESSTSVLQIGFQDDPDYLGLDDVNVTPVPNAKMQLTSVAKTATTFRLRYAVSPGAIYQLQCATNLMQPVWVDVGPPQTAAAEAMEFADTNSAALGQCFYRLKVK